MFKSEEHSNYIVEKMAAYNPIISEMSTQLHRSTNVRRNAILHEYCANHTLTLLKCQKQMVTYKYFIPLASKGTGNGTRTCDLLEKNRSDDAAVIAHHHLFRL